MTAARSPEPSAPDPPLNAFLKSAAPALALLGSAAVVSACEEKSPAEDAAEDVKDAVKDIVDKTNRADYPDHHE
jgi:hypothetical protein